MLAALTDACLWHAHFSSGDVLQDLIHAAELCTHQAAWARRQSGIVGWGSCRQLLLLDALTEICSGLLDFAQVP
jgi:hypothetical protein